LAYIFDSNCLSRADLETEQDVGNQKHTRGEPMTDLRFDSDIWPIPHSFLQRVKSAKFGLKSPLRRFTFQTEQTIIEL